MKKWVLPLTIAGLVGLCSVVALFGPQFIGPVRGGYGAWYQPEQPPPPPNPDAGSYVMDHLMVATVHGTSLQQKEQMLLERKAAGFNVVWAHLDEYWMTDGVNSAGDSIARNNLIELYTAAANVGDIYIMPGPVGRKYWADNPPNGDPYWAARYQWKQLIEDFKDHPAQFRINGVPVFSAWAYDDQGTGWTEPDGSTRPSYFTKYAKPILDAAGLVEGRDYMLWVHTFYPVSTDPGVNNITNLAPAPELLDVIHQNRPEISGLLEFMVGGWGSGTDQNSVVDSNASRFMTANSNLLSFRDNYAPDFLIGAGISAIYHSSGSGDHELGFEGLSRVLEHILGRAPEDRPEALVFTTGNDYAELSYLFPVPGSNGEAFTQFPAGFSFGPNIRRPLADHSGLVGYVEPYVRAFREGTSGYEPWNAHVDRLRVFAWYTPHPGNVSARLSTDRPAELPNDYDWANSYYVNKPGWIGGLHTQSERIWVGVHAPSPVEVYVYSDPGQGGVPNYATLKTWVGGVEKDAGIGVGIYRGYVRFSDLDNVYADIHVRVLDYETKEVLFDGVLPEPIRDDIYPSAGNPLVVELDNQYTPADPTTVGIHLYVAASGNDANPGTQDLPLRTLYGAFMALRERTGRTSAYAPPPSGWEGATIHLVGAEVEIGGVSGSSLGALRLDMRDSGSEVYPVRVVADTPGVRLVGAGPANAWTDQLPVGNAPSDTWTAVFDDFRVSAGDVTSLASLPVSSWSGKMDAAMNREALVDGNGDLVPLARWPDPASLPEPSLVWGGAELSADGWVVPPAVDDGSGASPVSNRNLRGQSWPTALYVLSAGDTLDVINGDAVIRHADGTTESPPSDAIAVRYETRTIDGASTQVPEVWAVAGSGGAWWAQANAVSLGRGDWASWDLTNQAPFVVGFLANEWAQSWNPVLMTGAASVYRPNGGTKPQDDRLFFSFDGDGSLMESGGSYKYAVLNVLETLEPGEMVFWPKQKRFFYRKKSPDETLSGVNGVRFINYEYILDLLSTAYIEFHGVTFAGARKALVHAENCLGLRFEGCTFKSSPAYGILINDSRSVVFKDCVFTRLGRGVGNLHGGHAEALAESGNLVDGCTFRDIGFYARDYVLKGLSLFRSDTTTGDMVGGPLSEASCGTVVQNCRFEFFRGFAASTDGPKCKLIGNTFIRTNMIDGDSGAAGAGGFSFSNWGVVIEHNVFKDITRHPSNHPAYGALYCLYVDTIGAVDIRYNGFVNTDHAIITGSGWGARIYGNWFQNAGNGFFGAPVVISTRNSYENVGARLNETLQGGWDAYSVWDREYPGRGPTKNDLLNIRWVNGGYGPLTWRGQVYTDFRIFDNLLWSSDPNEKMFHVVDTWRGSALYGTPERVIVDDSGSSSLVVTGNIGGIGILPTELQLGVSVVAVDATGAGAPTGAAADGTVYQDTETSRLWVYRDTVGWTFWAPDASVDPALPNGTTTLKDLAKFGRETWQNNPNIYYNRERIIEHNGLRYRCIQSHNPSSDREPGVGANWTTYWTLDSI